MRVTFICSSLEPGRDGVGDYTRRLADSLVRQGHHAQLIALNDRYAIADAGVPPSSAAGSDSGNTLRIAAATPWQDRVSRARAGIEAFSPDWISVQFVAYGFDRRGLVWRLGDRLRALARSTPTHVMFHELWIGDGRGAMLRRRLEGRLQKCLILQMVRRLRPSVVHAQASPYVAMLRRSGVAATRLPLFGNVPVNPATDRGWLCDAFREAGLPRLLERREDFWVFGLFGTLHPEWTPEPLLSRISEAATTRGKQPVLVAIGRLGASGRQDLVQHRPNPCPRRAGSYRRATGRTDLAGAAGTRLWHYSVTARARRQERHRRRDARAWTAGDRQPQ